MELWSGQYQPMLPKYAKFLGLASYYRLYIAHFSNVTAPYSLTQTGVTFTWSPDCYDTFNALKHHLTNVPVLAYSSFSPISSKFSLQTDASAIEMGCFGATRTPYYLCQPGV